MGEVRQKCQRGVRSISAKFGHLHKIEQPIVMIVMMIIIASCQIDITMTMRQKSIEKIKRQLAEGLRLQGGNFRRTFVQKGTLASSGIFSTREGISSLKMQIKRPLAPQFASQSAKGILGLIGRVGVGCSRFTLCVFHICSFDICHETLTHDTNTNSWK